MLRGIPLSRLRERGFMNPVKNGAWDARYMNLLKA